MKPVSNRLLRVGENLRSLLSKHILSGDLYIKHLKNTIVTITEVKPSKDLKYAKVYVSTVGGNEENVAKALNNSAKLLSKLVAKEIETKYSPKLSFFPDLSHKKAIHINKIINEYDKNK